VHTDVGNRCVAAKVDRRLVAAAHGAAQRPDRRDHHGQGRKTEPGVGQFRGHREGARAIRQYLKNLKRSEAIDLGKRLLNQRWRNSSANSRKSGFR
jgi:guanosine-3',5'-bis(diphosphate) 3'-pyrophosphohydrolase